MAEPTTLEPSTQTGVSPPPVAASPPTVSPPPPPISSGAAASAGGSSPPVTGAAASPAATQAGSGSGITAGQSPATQALAGQQQPVNEWQQRFETLQREFDRQQPLARMGYVEWQKQQQTAQQPPQSQTTAPAKPTNPFGLPDFDHGLLQFITRGSDGRLFVDPGAPPDTLARYNDYTEKIKVVQQKFWQDPIQFLGPQIQQMAEQIAQKQVQQHLGGYQEQIQTRQILERNADWLYAKDAQGQRQFQTDPLTGQTAPALSPYGQVYLKYIREAGDLGISTAAKQDQYATAMLQNAIHNARSQQQAGQQQGQQQAQNFLQNSAANAASPPPPAAVINPPTSPGPMSMREKMRLEFQKNGITDANVSVNGAA